ncbi:MAG TPA: T9SS type A sorting domain-containing protein [Flavipsychrobacter sp.]|nr:T9SS type A sorting domain-containing protein [Flavipsychrobacter sp.]
MKKHIYYLLLTLCGLSVKAQVAQYYNFSQSTGTYVPLGAGATILAAATDPNNAGSPETGPMDDYVYTNNSLPFSFSFNGITYTSFDVSTNGWIAFGGTNSSSTGSALSTSTGNVGKIVPFGTDLMGVSNAAGIVTSASNTITNVTNTAFAKIGAPFRSGTNFPVGTTITGFTSNTITVSNNATGGSTSAAGIQWALAEIKTELSGTAPNRTFTIEFTNFAEYFAATTTAANTTNLNFQIILNEGGGNPLNQSITMVYGNIYRFSGSETPQVGLGGSATSDYNNRSTTSNWSTTTAGTSNSATCTWSATVGPANGLTYTWTPVSCLGLPAASTITASNITTATADIAWSQSVSLPANGYDYYYSTSSTAPNASTIPTGSTLSGDTTESLSGLTPSTTYYLWVRANCGPTASDVSSWKAMPSFSTSCIAPSNDNCANAILLTQSSACINTPGTTCGATQSMAAAPCSGNPDDDVWFKFVATNTDAQIELSNIVAATGSSIDAYFQVLDGGTLGTCSPTMPSMLCSDPNTGIVGGLTIGNTYFVRVYVYGANPNTINFNICIREVSAAPTTCATLTNPAANNSVNSTPTLTWGSVTNASAYDIYLDANNPPSSLVATVSGSTLSYTVPAPLALGDYYWYVVPKNSLGGPVNCASNARKFTVIAPPANDECSGAIALTQGATCVNTAGTTLGATLSMAAAPCFGNPDDDVWYSFVATNTDASIELSNVVAAAGTSTDAYFQVLDGGALGTCSLTMPSILCSDPNTATIGGLVIGNTYFIRVYTYPANPNAINFNICVKNVSAAPTSCATLNNPGANNSVSSTPTLAWTSVTNASMYDIYLDSNNPPTTLAGTSNTLNYTLTTPLSPGDYYWYVAPKNTLGTVTTCATNARKFTVVSPPPSNDDCSNAIVLTHSSSVIGTTGTTLGATQSMAPTPCFGNPDDDVWYKFTATYTSAQIDLSGVTASTTANTSTDAYFQVLDGGVSGNCTGSLPSLLCSDPNSGTVSGLTIGNTYFIRVYTYALSASINYSISVSGAPLAIKLKNIAATNIDKKNQVMWSTLSEEPEDFFELEKSSNGREFIKIYSKQAKGQSSTYTYWDENPEAGINYYRLKMIDADGKFEYSKIVQVISGSKDVFEVRAYPNPLVDNKLTVEITGSIKKDAVISVTDLTGKNLIVIRPTSNKTDIDMSNITSGLYLIKYTDGTRSHTVKVTK